VGPTSSPGKAILPSEPPWLGLLREAADAAKREGMLLDLSANADGRFRGDWVPREESLHKVELATLLAVEGPTKFVLPASPGRGRKQRRRRARRPAVNPRGSFRPSWRPTAHAASRSCGM